MQNSSLFLLSHSLAKWIIERVNGSCYSAADLQGCHTYILPNCGGAIPRRQKAWLIFPIKLQKSIIPVDGTLASLTIWDFFLCYPPPPNGLCLCHGTRLRSPHSQNQACTLLQFCWTYLLGRLCNASWFRDAWVLCGCGKSCLAFPKRQ